MFHDNDRQLVVNLDYEFRQERTCFMITKTLFIRYSQLIVTLV